MAFPPEKRIALLISLTILVAIYARVTLTLPDVGGAYDAALWSVYRFFTVLTNTLVALIFLFHALIRPVGAGLLAGMTLWITLVGVIYYTLLAGLTDFSGAELVIDYIFHLVVPSMTVIWWLVYAPKGPLAWWSPIAWLLWPVAYCGYAV